MVAVFVLYMLALVGLGLYQGRKARTDEDFAIGGRKVPGFIAAMSERATGESAWCLLAFPGIAYATGASSIWVAVGLVLGYFIAWIFIALRLRDEAERCEAVSLIDWIAKRHGALGKAIRLLGSLLVAFFFFFYVGAQFIGGGKTFNSVFGIDPNLGIILTALIIIPYSTYGGFQSVVYTDTMQALLMVTALGLAPLVGLFYIARTPGLFANSVVEALTKAGPSYASITGGLTGFAAAMLIISNFSWFFGCLGGQPQLSARFMSIKDRREAVIGRNAALIWILIAYAGAILIGWLGIAIFGPQGLADAEQVMPSVMMKLFPPALAALFIVAAVAAMLSTADSLLILSSTEVTEDIIKPFIFKGHLPPEKGLKIARAINIVLAAVALGAVFMLPTKFIYSIVQFVWSGLGNPLSVIVILTLFWKRFNSKGALATMVLGMLFTIVWTVMGMDKVFPGAALSFFFSLAVAIIVTLATKPDAPGLTC